jgi:hypothetical protein
MGLFWEGTGEPAPEVERSFRDALATPPASVPDLDAAARQRAAAVANASPPATLKKANLIVALAVVAVLIGCAIGTDAAHLPSSSKALFGLATTAFGIVVGLLTGEKPKA